VNGARVPAIGPDGSPITVPRERVGELEEAQGSVQTQEQADAQDAQAAKLGQPASASELADSYTDTTAASMHGLYRGLGEAVGLPVDAGAVGVASLFGKDTGKRTREYLKGLDERHPYITGLQNVVGNVGGAVGASEALGVGAGGATNAARAARIVQGGVENVVQSTTRDVNEAALGDTKINSQKLVAGMPKHFLIGALITGGFEAGSAGLEAGSAALTRRAAPKLEAGASRAVGQELGLEGEEAIAAGQRVRGLHGGEIPKDRGELEGILTTEQGAQRARAAAEHSSVADALVGAQKAESEGLAAYHGGLQKSARDAGERGIAEAEEHAVDAGWEGLASREAHVAEAEGVAASRTGAAHAAANDADLAAIRAERALDPEALYSEVAAAGRSVHEVQGHYETVLSEIEQQHSEAARAVATFEKEHAEITAELAAAKKRIGPVPMTAEQIAATGKSNYVKGPIYRVGSVGSPTGNRIQGPYEAGKARGRLGLPYRKADAEAAEALAAAEASGNATNVAEVERLTALQKEYETAHEVAAKHLDSIEKQMRETQGQAQRDVRKVSEAADQRVAGFQKSTSTEAAKANEKAAAALENVRRVEEETRAFVEEARTKGESFVAKAEKRGQARLESARADADAAAEEVNRVTIKERQQLETAHEAQRAGLKPPSEKTDVDPLLKGMRGTSQRSRAPMFSPHAGMGAVFSLVHGHPLGAAGALLGSFAAGQARNIRNLTAARTMRNLSNKISAVDTAIRRGAARLLGHAGAAAAMGTERELEEHVSRREPKFDDVAKSVVDLQANPMELEHRVRHQLGHLVTDAPQHYQEVLAQAQRAQVYLFSILPVPSRDPNTLTPQFEKGDVSDTEQYDFMQAVGAVDDPLSVFAHTKAGTITQSQVDAIAHVYPDLYDQMRNEIRYQTMSLKAPIDYDDEVNIGSLMGVVTNQVLEPDFQAQQRRAYASKAAAGAPVGGAGSKAGSGSKLVKSMQSGSEALEGGTQ
jgi:hypothetical protein